MFGIDQAMINSVVLSIISAGLGVAGAWWLWRKDERKKKVEADIKVVDETDTRIQDLERQLAVLTATFQPISAAFQAVLIKQLTHFHTPEMDKLLEQVAKGGLSNSEERKLRNMLVERAKDLNGRIDDSEREAALMLPLVMNRVRAGATIADSEVMVVLVPKDKEK